MNSREKWDYLTQLEGDLLKGGVTMSEWAAFLIRDAQTAWCEGAPISAVICSCAAIECYLCAELQLKRSPGLREITEQSTLPASLVADIGTVRSYRNSWVHVKNPVDDELSLTQPEQIEAEAENMGKLAVTTLMRVVYLNQWV